MENMLEIGGLWVELNFGKIVRKNKLLIKRTFRGLTEVLKLIPG